MRSLLDSSVLVYADSADEPQHQRRAIDLIKHHRAAGTAVLAVQGLQEYTSVALRQLSLPIPLVRARLAFYGRFELVATTPEVMAGALDLHALHGLSLHDALIVRAAIVSGCAQVLSETLPGGLLVAGTRIVNPFAGVARR